MIGEPNGGQHQSRPAKTATLIAQRIVHEIFERHLTEGDPLPPEREMLEAYNVGRGTLREALRYLEIEGVLEIRPGRNGGPVVASPTSRHLASTLALLLQFHGTPFRRIMEARFYLEPTTARLATERLTPDLERQLLGSVERMTSLIGDMDDFLVENRNFHEAIAWGSDNPLLGYLLNSLHWITDGSRLGAQYSARYQRAITDAHRRIVEAMVARDAERAAAEMSAHIQEAIEFFERRNPEILNRDLRWGVASP